jgi:hypothetical protein
MNLEVLPMKNYQDKTEKQGEDMLNIPMCDLCYNNIIAGEKFFESTDNVVCSKCSAANSVPVNRVMIDHTQFPYEAKIHG